MSVIWECGWHYFGSPGSSSRVVLPGCPPASHPSATAWPLERGREPRPPSGPPLCPPPPRGPRPSRNPDLEPDARFLSHPTRVTRGPGRGGKPRQNLAIGECRKKKKKKTSEPGSIRSHTREKHETDGDRSRSVTSHCVTQSASRRGARRAGARRSQVRLDRSPTGFRRGLQQDSESLTILPGSGLSPEPGRPEVGRDSEAPGSPSRSQAEGRGPGGGGGEEEPSCL